MAHLSVQDLQDVAVACTSDFYNHNIPLSVGLAKQAAARDWNSDQVKRAIEATNTLAYLKSVEGSDRTGEFPLADYGDIMKYASVPDGLVDTQTPEKVTTGIDVKAKYEKSIEDQGFPVPCVEGELSKDELPELSKAAELKFLMKEAAINKRALEDAQARAFHLTLDLEKTANELKKLPHAAEAVSVTAHGDQFVKLARLTFGTESAPSRIDWVDDILHAPKDWQPALQKAAALNTLLTQAQETVAEINHRSGLDKQAGLITNLAMGVGKAVRGVATAPFRFVGNKVANGASAAIDTAATKIQSGLASTGMGQRLGIQPGSLKPSTIQTMKNSKRMIAGATLAGGAALDAASFKPHDDPSKGTNGDVWNALN